MCRGLSLDVPDWEEYQLSLYVDLLALCQDAEGQVRPTQERWRSSLMSLKASSDEDLLLESIDADICEAASLMVSGAYAQRDLDLLEAVMHSLADASRQGEPCQLNQLPESEELTGNAFCRCLASPIWRSWYPQQLLRFAAVRYQRKHRVDLPNIASIQ